MLFNSLQYAVFLPVVFGLYWLLPHRYRWFLILISSYYFYMCWNAKYLVLIVFITGVAYAGGLLLEKVKEGAPRKFCVAGVSVASLGLLLVFKYFQFLWDTVTNLFARAGLEMPSIAFTLLLPVGISFYTFQAIGYVIDVYRGEIEAEHHFGKFAAFVAFFPQLVAGPIERTKNLLPQLKKERRFDYAQAAYGLKLMAWGYFKKMVVADTLAAYVDKVYVDVHFFSGGARFLAILFFTVQIYCDFSGYTDIARGTAKLLGIELMENFKSPYFASSIREFWKRWHISLSSWFRDYVYIPLGGNRCGRVRNAVNVMITFLLSGLWHGASWNFVAWGGLHGGVQVAERQLKFLPGKKIKVPRAVKVFITFVLVSVFWVFFRAGTFRDAAYMIVFCFQNFKDPLQWLGNGCSNLGIGAWMAAQILFMIGLLFAFDLISLKKDVIACIGRWKAPYRWALYIAMALVIFFLAPARGAEFIYFDF